MMTDEERILEAWKVTVGVQQHFNELQMRIRSIAITVLGAFLAAAGFSLKEHLHVTLAGWEFPLTTFILAAATLCWAAFYFMDRHGYHRLLRGAVDHGISIENGASNWPELGLTKRIGDASPITIGKKVIRSGSKIDLFYGAVAFVLFLGVLATLFNQDRPPEVRKVGEVSIQPAEPKKELPPPVDANTVGEPTPASK
jgi:hypothetical protein